MRVSITSFRILKMPDKDASTPRVFIIRHGETEWTLSGAFTGKTDIALTGHGERQVENTARLMYGPGKLIDPAKVAKVWLSPRKRAITTFAILSGKEDGYEITESLAEWDYGYVRRQLTETFMLTGCSEYEGIKTNEIRAKRKSHGLDKDRAWDIWRDGCEGGE